MKHRLKLLARGAYARVLYHTGLDRLVDRLMPRRLTILAGHCVADEETNGGLPADMKISAARLRHVLSALGRRYRLVTVDEGIGELDAGAGKSMVALTMDDGYLDNRTVLQPLLEEVGAKATIFLESRPLDERRVNWSHKWFWLLAEGSDPADLARAYAQESSDAPTADALRRAADGGGDVAYLAKRVLKYDAPPVERERVLDELFTAAGGDERELCDRIYMTWDHARELAGRGVELGGHTVHHAILSRLDAEGALAEVEGGRASLVRELGESAGRTFAYPFGRRWDFDDASRDAVRRSGFERAVTTHAGTNDARTDRTRLSRWMIDEGTPMHLLVAEACGGFALLRRLGVDLSE